MDTGAEKVGDAQLVLYRDDATGLDFAGDIGETTPVSWQPRGNLSFEEWIAIGNTLQQVNASLNWWIGDWLNYGERKWGEMYAQAVEATGWDYDRLAKAKWVSKRVEFWLRNQNLTWSHHKEVAGLEPEEQAVWLNRAATERWSVRQLRDALRGIASLPDPDPLLVHSDDTGEAPFNHITRWDVPADERTPVDEYEQQPDTRPAVPVSMPHVAHNSGNNEWYTPLEYIEAARRVLGGFDLDPASSDAANEVVQARQYFTIATDGLRQPWAARSVWLNPPYAADLVGKFIDKLLTHFCRGEVEEAIVLVNNATETQWFQTLAREASAICFPKGRVRFWSPEKETSAPLQGQALVYLGPARSEFVSEFERFGFVAYL